MTVTGVDDSSSIVAVAHDRDRRRRATQLQRVEPGGCVGGEYGQRHGRFLTSSRRRASDDDGSGRTATFDRVDVATDSERDGRSGESRTPLGRHGESVERGVRSSIGTRRADRDRHRRRRSSSTGTSYTIVTAAATAADTNYNGLNPADVSVTNTDNDIVWASR